MPAAVAIPLLTLLLVATCVLLHYEGLSLLQRRLVRVHLGPRRTRVLAGIGGVLTMHALEILIFAGGYRLALLHPDAGGLVGPHDGSWFDWAYFSATTYTTLGIGDIAPVGPVRMIVAVESLLGLVLIAWSASFTYLEMERFWTTRQ